MRKNTLQVAILNAILLMGGAMAYPETAYAQSQAQTYSIAGGELESVLSRFGTESRIQLIYPPELLKGKRSNGLTGSHTPTEALRLLLEGSGLVAERVNDKTVVIKKGAAPAAEPKAAPRDTPKTTRVKEAEVEELETVTVTGTRIRGGTSPSPTIVMGEEQFRQEGFTDLGQVIRSIPQNFRGGQNPGVTTGASQGAQNNQNITGGAALNLRGLGPDATLTLLNGRRLGYDGYSQGVDISAIPIDAVKRIEIVPDGSSAIYGSDAVGGVANVVLRRDFDGVTLGALYGDSADGGLKRHEYTATAGTVWDSGGLIATFKKSDQDPIYADQRDYTQAMAGPTALYPGSTLRSGLVSAHQSLGDVAELRLDTLRTVREQSTYAGYGAFYLLGATETTATLFAPSLQVVLPGDWLLTAGTSRGKSESYYNNVLVTNGVSTPSSSGVYLNETRAWELGVEGALAQFGQRELRLAAGVGGRKDDFLSRGLAASSTRQGGDESSRYAYGELALPIIGADNARPGLHRLEFSAAVRSEDYDSFGRVTTPKLGVIYDPSADFTLRASWGRSFKAPTLLQRNGRRYTALYSAQMVGCVSCAPGDTVLFSSGGNTDLEPERARTWTTSLAFHPESIPALDAELTFFAVDYTDRVIAPIGNNSQTMSDPAYAQFIQHNPSADQLAQLLAVYSGTMNNYAGAPYDPSRVVAMVAGQYTNVAQQRAKGFDLTGNYGFDLASGRLVLRGSVSRLDLSQRNSRDGAEFDLSGRIYFPSEWNSRLGVVWSQGGLSASAFANYTSGVTSRLTAVTEKIGSFTTFDTTLRYETAPGIAPLSGVTLALSVENLFNRAPPLYNPAFANVPPYDSTNYSAIGRYVTVSVSKHW